MSQDFNNFPPRFPQDFQHGYSVGLYEPENPMNVGSIARTCAVTSTPLHLVGAVGFILDTRLARRAGLDYWEHAEVHVHRTWAEFEAEIVDKRVWMFSTKGKTAYWDADFKAGDVFLFGSERAGLPGRILESGRGEVLTIPMMSGFRSLNLSNSVAIVLYEAIRQQFRVE